MLKLLVLRDIETGIPGTVEAFVTHHIKFFRRT